MSRLAVDPRAIVPGPRAGFDFVVLAASLGGVEALLTVVSGLPANLQAAVSVVLHRDPAKPSLLRTLLQRGSVLPVEDALPDMRPRRGFIYVAPAGAHLRLSRQGRFTFDRRGRIGFIASSADPLLRSAAQVYGSRVIGVILTGGGHDGALGSLAVTDGGGLVIAEDPTTARAASMPAAAIAAGGVSRVLALAQIAPALTLLVAPVASRN